MGVKPAPPKAPEPAATPAEPPTAANAPTVEGKLKQDHLKDQLANRADELAKRSAGWHRRQGVPGGFSRRGPGRPGQGPGRRPQAQSESMIPRQPGTRRILDRYGLPPVWNDRVTPSALASAEPDLRSYYMSAWRGMIPPV